VALLLVDFTALAVATLRPAQPGLTVALRDVEYLAMGICAPLVSAMLAGFAMLGLRDARIWPAWVGRLAVLAAIVYVLRLGTLFTTGGVFSGSGVLGLWLPATALAAWTVVASLMLARELRGGALQA